MTNRIMLIGGPDSGKTNYLARLWQKLKAGDGALSAPKPPSDITYVEGALAHLLQGSFAPRTETDGDSANREFDVTVAPTVNSAKHVQLLVPDVSGELWKHAVETTELPQEWMARLRGAAGALLFVRAHSEANIQPLDWVTAQKLLAHGGGGEEEGTRGMPTQVALCELLRYLEGTLGADTLSWPRVGVVVTAWDLIDAETSAGGPDAYLQSQFPLFAGRIADSDLDVKAFGVSILGGDLTEDNFKQAFLSGSLSQAGYVVTNGADGKPHRDGDISVPVLWVLDGLAVE